MTISKDEVLYVSHLARLDVPAEEMDKLAQEIDDILSYVATLNEADTEGIEPTAQPVDFVNRLREDEVKPVLGSAKAVENSHDSSDGMFVVPKVVKN